MREGSTGIVQNRMAILAAVASAALFGASTPTAKLLLGSVQLWMLAGVLYLGAGLGLAALALVQRLVAGAPREAPLRHRDLPWLALIVLFGGVLGPVLLMLGLSRIDAASAALLLNLEGLATMTIAWLVVRENVDRRILLGAAAILLGALILSGSAPTTTETSWGALAIIGACLAWAIDNNLTRKLSAGDPVQIAMIKGLAAGAVNLALALLTGGRFPSLTPLALALLVGFLGYGLSLTLFVVSLRHLGTARTAAYFSTAPFIGAALAVMMLGEPVTSSLLLAGGLMAIGVWLHLTERHDHLHAHAPIEHEHAHRHDEHHRHAPAASEPPGEPHSHLHRHQPMVHRHPHYPDLHHQHEHG